MVVLKTYLKGAESFGYIILLLQVASKVLLEQSLLLCMLESPCDDKGDCILYYSTI